MQSPIRFEILREIRRVGERELRGVGFEEEIEGIDRREIEQQVYFNDEFGRLLRKDETREMIAKRILLPVY